jgi:hypothetical protein
MYFAEPVQEKHTFILITDYAAETLIKMGLYQYDDLFNVPFPLDYSEESVSLLEDLVLGKTIYSGTVEFYKPKN